MWQQPLSRRCNNHSEAVDINKHIIISIITLCSFCMTNTAQANLCGVIASKRDVGNEVEYTVKNKCQSAIQINACTRFMTSGNLMKDGKRIEPNQSWTFRYTNFDQEDTAMKLNNCRAKGLGGADDCAWVCPEANSKSVNKLLGTWKTRGKLKGQTLIFLTDGSVTYTNVFSGGKCVYMGKGNYSDEGIRQAKLEGSCLVAGRDVAAKPVIDCKISSSTSIKCQFSGGKGISFHR